MTTPGDGIELDAPINPNPERTAELKARMNSLETPLAGGVWALLDADYLEAITAVYPTELDALRVVNGRGYGRVAFIPWGHTANGEPVES